MPLEHVELGRYREALGEDERPVIVFFYANVDDESQRVATLIRYLAPDYGERIRFYAVRVSDHGKPPPRLAQELAESHGVESTPGVLFYRNVGGQLTLAQEEYIDPDFREFRSPGMLLWRTYYQTVQRELDRLLAD